MSEKKQANQINFDYNGKHYCLEYNRETVLAMEQAGYKPGQTGDTPMVELNMLWAGAFRMHHSEGADRVSPRRIEEILNEVTMDKLELLDILREMIAETYTTLMKGNDQGNVKLTVIR